MVYRPPYPWFFYLLVYLLIRNEEGAKYHGGSIYHTGGGQFSVRGVNIPWMKIDPGVNLPWGSKYHMTPGLYFYAVQSLSYLIYNKIEATCTQI